MLSRILASVVLLCVPALPLLAGDPAPFPARMNDGGLRDLFVVTLGSVQTPLAQGMFDPRTDEFTLRDGRTVRNWYRDSLGIAYYAPIDKSVFTVPPSGWCSWYYYYQEFDEEEIRRNARWMAENMKEFGALYVQIDDGWQGAGRGLGENRDWTTIDRRFPGGMDGLARDIRKLGLKAGLWLAPHGQSNAAVVRANPGVFLLKPDGTSASETWEGTYLVDPSTPAAHEYLARLFRKLSGWGYDYFKIDGQPIVVDEFLKKHTFMRVPADSAAGFYRGTLRTIRGAIGKDSYLLGCWGIPLEGAGIMNGSRTGGDIVLGWDGFKVALDATMQYYFLHNVVWYCDPDVMVLRSPLTVEQARVWATLQGLTGQGLMASDRMPDLGPERVEILKRVYPAVDARPLDLFPSKRSKRIWDLKVSHLGRSYDVVGLFNFNEGKPAAVDLRWTELGLPAGKPVHVYDFWNREYLGCFDAGLQLEVPPTSCRVLTLLPADDGIRLISTSRHITQGWVDLKQLREGGTSVAGESRVIKGDPYELRFVFPRGKNYKVARAVAGGLPVRVSAHQGWARVEFTPSKTGTVAWRVEFAPDAVYSYPVRKPSGLEAVSAGLNGAALRWNPQYYLNSGYAVWLDSVVQGYTPVAAYRLAGLEPGRRYRAEVATVWEDGRMSGERAVKDFVVEGPAAGESWLTDLEPASATIGWGSMEMDRAVTGKPLTVGGRVFRRGIGTHAKSDVVYELFGLFKSFGAAVGVDDGNGSEKGTVEFVVWGDERELWRSGPMKKGERAKEMSVPVEGIRRLRLEVTDGGDGIDYDHADWLDPKLFR